MNVTIEAYSPEGFKVTLQANCESHSSALRFTANAAKAGFTAAPPVEGARKSETIATVIRRQKINDDGTLTPIIDMYPAWGVKDYGQYRFVGMYLDSEEAIREFEQRAGVKLADMPLVSGAGPIKRNQRWPDPNEVKCKPFIAHKVYLGEKDINGKVEKVYKFVGYGEIATAAPDPEPATPKPAAKPILPGPGSIRAAQPPAPSKPIDGFSAGRWPPLIY